MKWFSESRKIARTGESSLKPECCSHPSTAGRLLRFISDLSALIAATVVTIMLLVWYPPPYFDAMGGQGLLKILVGVDVTLGPLLTLIIFDPRKKSLRFDLSVIAALQIAALAYGVWVMFEARPVYTAFAMDRFDIVSANQLDPSDLDAGPPEYRELPSRGRGLSGYAIRTRRRIPKNGTSWCSPARRARTWGSFPNTTSRTPTSLPMSSRRRSRCRRL